MASADDDLHVTFDPLVGYFQVAAAAVAGFGLTFKRASEIETAMKKELDTVRAGTAAAVDVWLPKFEVVDVMG